MKIQTLATSALLALAVAACGSAGSPAPTPGGSATATSATPITVRDFKFDTPNVALSGPVALAVTNAGPTVHDLSIRDAAGTVLGETSDLKAGASETLTVDLPAGTYTIFCSLPGHESLGIKGTLTVSR
jgi:plastocyanin